MRVEHGLHDANFCALRVVSVGGEVEEVGVLPGAGGCEEVVHHNECAVVVLDHAGEEEAVELGGRGRRRGLSSARP